MQTKEVIPAFAGNIQVLSNIKRKQELLDAHDPEQETIKLALVLPGGAHRGIHQAGVVRALERMGLSNVFDYYVASSSGAIVGLYTISGEAAMGTKLIHDDNLTSGFIDLARFWRIVDLEIIKGSILNSKPLDPNNFYASRPDFYVGLTSVEDGSAKLVNVKETSNYQEALEVVLASSSLAVFSGNRTLTIDGKKYADGVPAMPLGAEVARQLGATDILVASAHPIGQSRARSKLLRSLIDNTIFRSFPPLYKEALHSYHERFNIEVEEMLKGETNFAIIYPETSPVTRLCSDRDLLVYAADVFDDFTQDLFTRC